ncbi:MAG: metallophosphoesterase family protein [Methanobacteriota archaeon]
MPPRPTSSTVIVSDIHADAAALERLLHLAAHPAFGRRFGDVTRLVNLGDVVERGYRPRETLDLLQRVEKELPVAHVSGNHDEAFLRREPISGSDSESEASHRLLADDPSVRATLGRARRVVADPEGRAVFAHGGPVDEAGLLPADADGSARWLASPSWQRLDAVGAEGLTPMGWHYRPETGFAHAARRLGGEGDVVLFLGHEHREALYEGTRDEGRGTWMTRGLLHRLRLSRATVNGATLDVKTLTRRPGRSHIVRVGLAGAEGYAGPGGARRVHFGIWSRCDDGSERVHLASFAI